MRLYVVMKPRGYIKPNSDTWFESQKHSTAIWKIYTKRKVIEIKKKWHWLIYEASTQQFAAVASAVVVLGCALSFTAGYLIVKALMN